MSEGEITKDIEALKAQAQGFGLEFAGNIGAEKLQEKIEDYRAKNTKFVVISKLDDIAAYEITGVGCFVKVGANVAFVQGTKIVDKPEGKAIVSLLAH